MNSDDFEHVVENDDSFSMLQLHDAVWDSIESQPTTAEACDKLSATLTSTGYKKLAQAVLRQAFLIELVKLPKVETTKFRVRWSPLLANDPRFCSFAECLEIADELLNSLDAWLQTAENAEAFTLATTVSQLPYEVPIDYATRLTGANRLHAPGNIGWYRDDVTLRALRIRKYLLAEDTSPDHAFFSSLLKDKIRVKTYLTDRVLTGTHKTNREKRWEAHPSSVHFALRRTCMEIEYALVKQVCAFDGFPQGALAQLQAQAVVPIPLPVAVCPITGERLNYQDLRNELLDPVPGKSGFHVGHLAPLKLDVQAGGPSGHSAANISWISADGNRIQGSLSVYDVRRLVKRVKENYDAYGWWPAEG